MDEEIITLLDEQGEEHDFTLRKASGDHDRPYACFWLLTLLKKVIVLRLDKDSDGLMFW